MEAALIVIGVLIFVAALVAFVFLVVFLMLRLFNKASGLSKLVDLYPANNEPPGRRYTRQTVKIGAVRYRFCSTACVSPQGLYLSVHPTMSKPHQTLIPWSEITSIRKRMLYWQSSRQLAIGEPQVATITVFMGLFDAIRPYLNTAIVGNL